MLSWHLKLFNELSLLELYTILRVRAEVFVAEQNCPYVDADGKDIKAYHLMGMVAGELAAYARLLPAQVSYAEPSIGRIITSARFRNCGYGKLLMAEAIAETEKLFGKQPIRIGAQAYLKKFYEGFGFEDIGEPYLEDGIEHIIMLRP